VPHVYFNARAIEPLQGRFKLSRVGLGCRSKRTQWIGIGMQEPGIAGTPGGRLGGRPVMVAVGGINGRPVFRSKGDSVRRFVLVDRRRIDGTAFGQLALRVVLSRAIDAHRPPLIRRVSECSHYEL